MPERPSGWPLKCSCGWTREFLQRWAAESAAKLHPKLGEPGTEHTVRIEVPPDQTANSLSRRSPSPRPRRARMFRQPA